MCLRSRQRDTTTLQCDSVLYVVSSVPVERHYLRFQQRDTISGSSRETILHLSCGSVLWCLRFQQRGTVSGSSRETLSPVPAERQYYAYRVVLCCVISGSNRETLSPVPAERHYLRFQQRETLLRLSCGSVLWCLRFQQRDNISGPRRNTILQRAVVFPVPAERH